MKVIVDTMRTRNANDPRTRLVATSPPDVERMLRIGEFAKILGIARRTFERMLSAGTFPTDDLSLGRIKVWRPSTVQAWIESESQRQQQKGRVA